MIPQTLIRDAARDGLTLAPTETGTLRVHGPKSAVAKWAPILKERKTEILAALRSPANDAHPGPLATVTVTEALISHWCHPDGRPLWVSPPESIEEVQARYPGAVPWTDADTVTVTELTPEDEATIRAWLASLGETSDAIEQDIETARRFPDTAAWLLARAHVDVTARAILHTCGDCQHFTHDPEGGGGIGTCAITKAGHPPKDATGYPLCYPFAQRRCPDFEAAKEAGKLT